MRLALNMPLLDRGGAALDAAGIQRRAKLMEQEGFDGIWLGDSFSPGMTRPDPLMWLLVAAAATERIEVGTSILIVPLRDPVELAQRLLTLQQLTGGRFTVGAAVEQYDGWMCSAGRTNLRTMKEAIKKYRDLGGKRAIISSCVIDFTAPTTPLSEDDPFHLRCDPKEAADRLHRVAELGFDDVLLVKQDHNRSRILHGAPEAGRTLSIYESDYTEEELPLIRSLLERDPRGPWDN